MRTPELALWLEVPKNAIAEAQSLARGVPLEKPSPIPELRRRQVRDDIRDLRLWLVSAEVGGLLWIASVADACVGPDLLDVAAIQREIRSLLRIADRYAQRVGPPQYARVSTQTVPSAHVPCARKDEARVLRIAPAPRTQTVGETGRGQTHEGFGLGLAASASPTQGRLALSVRGVPIGWPAPRGA